MLGQSEAARGRHNRDYYTAHDMPEVEQGLYDPTHCLSPEDAPSQVQRFSKDPAFELCPVLLLPCSS